MVKAYIQVQSSADKGVVSKLSYRAKGPFIITKDLGHDSFEVQRYDNPTSAKRKYTSLELYLLAPALFPSQPLDTINQQYLNSTHDPIVNPLMKSLKIELYNNKLLNGNSSNHALSTSPHVDQPSNAVNHLALRPRTVTPYPSTTKLHQSASKALSDHDTLDHVGSMDTSARQSTSTSKEHPAPSPPSSISLISESSDKIFFIHYTPKGSMQQHWYLM